MRIFYKKGPLCFSTLGALTLVSIEVVPWALALSALILFFRFGAEQKWWKNLSPLWVNIFSVSALALVLAQFRTFLGQEASSTLLVILASLRIADFKSERDEKFLILIGFILVALKFLFSLDLYWFPIGAAVFLGLWRSLLPDDFEMPWKMTLTTALKAFPVVALLFFVFPRVKIPWVRNTTQIVPITGMSESIGPGDISDLTMNKQTAFRAQFTNYRPTMRELYWRGAVLENVSGFRWSKTTEPVLDVQATKDEIKYDYSITLEPSELRVLPTLEHTRIISSPMINAIKTDRGTFRTYDPITSRVRYNGISTASWSGTTVKDPLQIEELPPKTKAWVDEARSKKLDYIKKIQLLKKFFSQNKFAYTRQPGNYTDLDEFLFDRKLGFCEHFAGSYATLARALGIPARVITGYQGGEWNDAGDFLRVSHADAHAWVEIRNPSGAWQRVDPTFWVAPLRIELGGISFFQLSPGDLSLGINAALERLQNKSWAQNIINNVQFQIDNLNYLWTKTLLGFDIAEQEKILKVIAPKIGWWLASIVLLFLIFVASRKFLFTKKQTQEQAIETYLWLQKKFTNLGYARELHEAPLVYLEKIKQYRPDDKVLIDKTIQLYRYERYRERKSGPDDWIRLKRAWKQKLATQQRPSTPPNNRAAS